MTVERSPQRQAIDEILADGRPHSREELLAAGAARVHPGRAARHAEALRSRKADAPRARTKHVTEAEVVATGARGLAREALDMAVRQGPVRRLPDGTYELGPAADIRRAVVHAAIYHQRPDITRCACGWSILGASHAEHVADVVLEQLRGA